MFSPMQERDVIRETGLIAYLLYGVSIVVSPAVIAGIIYVYRSATRLLEPSWTAT